ncbi:tyrosine-type recombinase/integrase [Peribacillus simplex]|uniref:tyrosine-type recombinase/integrase n=1 Tax=Peribacillus simplex TaxID=1478 RepID=UPI003D2CFD2E
MLKIAELNPKLTPHPLRHTHTSLLAEVGVRLPQIMERLGHKYEETTKMFITCNKRDEKRGFPKIQRINGKPLIRTSFSFYDVFVNLKMIIWQNILCKKINLLYTSYE